MGLVLPLVVLSSLIIFCVVEVGLIVYIAYLCQLLISLCFEWYDVACPPHVVYSTPLIKLFSHQYSRRKRSRATKLEYSRFQDDVRAMFRLPATGPLNIGHNRITFDSWMACRQWRTVRVSRSPSCASRWLRRSPDPRELSLSFSHSHTPARDSSITLS